MNYFNLSALSKVLLQTLLLLCLSVMSVAPTFAQNDIRVTYIHTDADGTPFAATDEQGNVEWQIEHQPYGKEHSNTEVRRESTLSFAGKAYDEEIGLSYFGGRWYSPELGRFMGIDPVGVNPEDWKTFNRYSYGFNNPYKYVDPDGNLAFLVPIAIFLAKEGLAEVASRATGGATDFLSVRRLGSKVVKKSLGALKKNRGGGGEGLCFVAGTLVHTPDGVKPIELIQEGDLVASKDEETGEQAWKPVVKLFRNEDKKVLNIRFASVTGEVAESIGTTAEHPFWVEGQGWVQAGELQVGDQISRQGQSLSQVMSITEDIETHTTYNFEVQDYHTYFVGEQALWVHNMCGVTNRGGLPDNAIVCRGGSCTADRFTQGSGVTTDAAGNLGGVSVNSAAGKSLKELTKGIPHNKVGVTTVGDVRKAGGNVIASPTKGNPNHATLSGVSAKKAEKLMNPTVKNPSK